MADYDMSSIIANRSKIISEFSGMKIDMNYMLCIPSVHAIYGDEDAVVDFEGGIREKSIGFPEEKINLLIEWIGLHKEEIIINHQRCGCSDYPLNPIKPL